MQGKRRQPLFAADYVAYLHEMVIHDVCQMIGRKLVGSLPQHLVVQGGAVHLDVPADQVIHLDHLVLGHLEAYCPIAALFQQSLHFAGPESQGIAQTAAGGGIVYECLPRGLGLRALFLQFFGGVECIVCKTVRYQLFGIFAVDSAPLRLAVRRMRVPCIGSFRQLAVGVQSFIGQDSAPA